MNETLICRELTKEYGRGTLAQTAVAGVSLECRPADTCVLLGPSGSGKTTLLSMLGCLLSPTSGHQIIAGKRVDYASPGALTAIRRDKIGFVFQHAQLLPFLTVEDNLRLVARNAGLRKSETDPRIDELTEQLGIGAYRRRVPAELSGGQRQRVAIARAVLHRPPIVLADEPTAALDWDNGQAAIRLLIGQAQSTAATLIVVTHDTRLVPLFSRLIRMDSGRIHEGIVPEPAATEGVVP